MTEAELAALGVHRIPVPIPFLQAGGPVNVYLVEEEGGGLLLFDTGLGSPEARGGARGRLPRGSAAASRRSAASSSRTATWTTSAARASSRSGTAASSPSSPTRPTRRRSPRAAGAGASAPEPTRATSRGSASRRRWLGAMAREGERALRARAPRPEDRPLVEGERVRTRHLDAARCSTCPATPPGSSACTTREHRLLFSGDHLLREGLAEPAHRARPGRRGGLLPAARRLPREHRAGPARWSSTSSSPGHGPPFARPPRA